jgi:protein NrfC
MNTPQNANPKNPSNQVSRRQFIKRSGTVMFVMGAGLWLPSYQVQAAQLKKVDHQEEIPASQGYLLVDIHKCQGCMSCMLACSLVHEGVSNLSYARIQIIQNPFGSFPHDVSIEQCRQCVKPACVEACPEDALGIHPEFGYVRMLDREKCVGCGACFEACPFKPSRITAPVDEAYAGGLEYRKCDLCAQTPFHWDAKGGGPKGMQACVEICPLGAIKFTNEIPVQDGNKGYKVNLREKGWHRLGYA